MYRSKLFVRAAGLTVYAALALGAPQALAQTSAPSRSSWPTLTTSANTGARQFVSDQQGVFNGHKLAYQATVGETIVTDRDGKPAASVFTLTYERKGVKDQASRPVVFIWNGGPGAASNTLLLGALGPKRMARFDGQAQADPKTPLIDNPFTILDEADLVFVDPPETGYSRLLPGVVPTTFRGNDADAAAAGQVIIRWLTARGRLASPKYLLGESYGTLRNVMVARDLAQGQPKIEVDGLIMVSQAITYNGPSSITGRRPSPLDAINRVGDAAALAWHHGLIDNTGQSLGEAIAKARLYARTDYAAALLQGNRLPAADRERIAGQLSVLTGYTPDYLLAHRLRIGNPRRELLASQGKVLAQFDGREFDDPVLKSDAERDWNAAVLGITANTEAYMRDVLKVRGLGEYRSIVPDPYGFEDTWTYIKPPAPLLDVVLTEQMRANPKLRLFAPQGVFDTTSSMGATDMMFAQLDIPADRVSVSYYPGGHMLYSDPPGLKAFTDDVRAFVAGQAITSNALKGAEPAVPR